MSASVLFLLAFGLRLIAAWIAGGFTHPELFEPYAMAKSLASGQGLVYASHGGVLYHSFDAPLYPALVAVVSLLTRGSLAAILVVQMLAGAALAVLVSVIGRSLFGRRAGLIGGLLIAVHPGLIVYASLKIHPLTFDALWFTLVCWQFIRLYDERTASRATWAGLTLGASLLQRPTALMFLPVAIAWLLATVSRAQWRQELQRTALVSSCALMIITPWLIREAIVHHKFVFIRSTNWEVFWRGNNPYATGHSYLDQDHLVLDTLPPALRAELERIPDEMGQAHWFRDQAFAFIQAHPWEFVRLTAKKFFYFWWFGPQTGVLYPRLWRIGYQGFYGVMVLLACGGLYGLVRQGSRRQRHVALFIVASLAALAVGQSLHYVEGRHRWAVEPLLLVLSSVGLARCVTLVSSKIPAGGTLVTSGQM